MEGCVELLTVNNAYTPDRLKKEYQELCFSGIYAAYARPGSLPEIAQEYLERSHHSSDGSGWILLYIGRGRRTSPTRFVGVRLCKELGGNTRESQAPLRRALCGVMFKSRKLRPCFQFKKDKTHKSVYLNPKQKVWMTRWCAKNVVVKIAKVPDPVLAKVETGLIQRYLPLLNRLHSEHPFSRPFSRRKRQEEGPLWGLIRTFEADGKQRPCCGA